MTSCSTGGGPDICPDLDQVHQTLQDLLPRGRAWAAARREGTVQWQFWRAVARLLVYANERICAAVEEAFCSSIAETRDLWMIEYGLPDLCDPFPDLCAKVAALGGSRCEYYQEVAARAGWVITCDEESGSCGGEVGCAEVGCAVPGGPSVGLLRVVVHLDESPAYVSPVIPAAEVGAMLVGTPLSCPVDYSALVCLMDRMVHAHLVIDYVVNAGETPAEPDDFAVAWDGDDIVLSWVADLGRAYVLSLHGADGAVLTTLSLTATAAAASLTWTAAGQVAVLGALATHVDATLFGDYSGQRGPDASASGDKPA